MPTRTIRGEGSSSNPVNSRAGLHSFVATRALGSTLLVFALMVVLPSAQAQTFSVLYSFASIPQGDAPGGLTQDAAGNLYGTTYYGGNQSGAGVVFKVDTTGEETVLYRFQGKADGQLPHGVIRDDAGNLYGTTSRGGSGCPEFNGCGTVFKLDAVGRETVLHRFGGKGDGRFPSAGVIRDRSGNLYGTTASGGTHSCAARGTLGCGTVFKVDPTGIETVLHSFTGQDGFYPSASLIQDEAGNLYGTAGSGGANSYGNVFQLDSTGNFTVLHNFTALEGCYAAASLLRDAAGNLYGTTSACGEFGGGTVFELDTSGKLIVLHTFTEQADGGNTSGPVVRDSAGNLYGTAGLFGDLTCFASTDGCGVAFKIDTAGQYTVLHTFQGLDGQWPYTGLIQDATGNLYGTTASGGNLFCFCGTVFKITP